MELKEVLPVLNKDQKQVMLTYNDIEIIWAYFFKICGQMPQITGGGLMTTCGKLVLSFHFVGSGDHTRWQVLSGGEPETCLSLVSI